MAGIRRITLTLLIQISPGIWLELICISSQGLIRIRVIGMVALLQERFAEGAGERGTELRCRYAMRARSERCPRCWGPLATSADLGATRPGSVRFGSVRFGLDCESTSYLDEGVVRTPRTLR